MTRARVGLLLLVLAACPSRPAAPPIPAAAPSAPTPWVRVRPAEGLSLLEVPARVLPSPDAVAEVVPPYRARVVRIHVRAGQRVARGAPILDVLAPELVRAAGAYVAAGTRLSAYSKHREQLLSLRSEGLVRLADLAEVETKVAEALADQQAALGTLRGADLGGADAARLLSGGGTLTLRAPIAGVVTALRAAIGETHENPDLPLAHIAGEGEVQIEARLSAALPPAAHVAFVTPAGETVPVRAIGSAPVVDARDGTRLSWYAPDLPAQSPRLPAGLLGRLRVTLPAGSGVVAVPARALLPGDGGAAGQGTVLLRRGAEIQKLPVEVLSTSGADALVRGPLREGDEVAAEASAALERP
jgi:hypothetical protein